MIGDEWDMMSDHDNSYLMGPMFLDTHSSFSFGAPKTRKTFNSYIFQFPNGEYRYIINPREWNHFCFAWSSGGRSKVVLVNQQPQILKIFSLIWFCELWELMDVSSLSPDNHRI